MFTLTWQPPYDWQWMLKFLGDRAVAGIEIVTPTDYTRSFACQGYRGLIHVTPQPQAGTLQVVLSDGLLPIADLCLARITRLFDLHCDPQQIATALGTLGAGRPGLRLPGSVDTWEQGVRAILGQLVSVAMARPAVDSGRATPVPLLVNGVAKLRKNSCRMRLSRA